MGLKGLTIEEQGSGIKFFAVGDVHGCSRSLEALLSKLPIRWNEDYLIFLGDYIDRGEDPRRALEIVMELAKAYPGKVIALKGNHEWMFERFLQGIDPEVFLYNGGDKTLRCYLKEGRLQIPDEHVDFLRSLPLYVQTLDYFFVHAGINPYKSLKEQDDMDLLWIRQSFYLFEGTFPKVVVFGHTPFPDVLMLEDRIGVDTGCVYGGKLSAVMLPDRVVFQV
jgi:serine/threonine protein phosphatase 1